MRFIISIILFVVAVVTSCSAETPEQIFPINNSSDVPMTGIQTISIGQDTEEVEIYDLYGNSVKNIDSLHGVFIVRNNQGTKKILK